MSDMYGMAMAPWIVFWCYVWGIGLLDIVAKPTLQGFETHCNPQYPSYAISYVLK